MTPINPIKLKDMNYYKVSNQLLESDGVDTYARWTDGDSTVVSDVDARRVLGFELTPEDVRKRYGVKPLTERELASVRRSEQWRLNMRKLERRGKN